jgi:hypothetical protein
MLQESGKGFGVRLWTTRLRLAVVEDPVESAREGGDFIATISMLSVGNLGDKVDSTNLARRRTASPTRITPTRYNSVVANVNS